MVFRNGYGANKRDSYEDGFKVKRKNGAVPSARHFLI
jgi:hypothetical protein